MCKDFSPWQRINKAKSMDPDKYDQAKEHSRKHLEFPCHVYGTQYKEARLFLHEHPQQASSWNEDCILEVANLPGVEHIDMDQYQYGQEDEHGNPVKKPTRWLSDSRHILAAISQRCGGKDGWCNSLGLWRRHAPCYGKVAAEPPYIHFDYVEQYCKDLQKN